MQILIKILVIREEKLFRNFEKVNQLNFTDNLIRTAAALSPQLKN